MAAADANPAETSEAVFSTSPQNACPVCSTCRSLLIRPTSNPDTQDWPYTNPHLIVRQSLSQAHSAAVNGCAICNLVLAAQASVDHLDGFKLALRWNSWISTSSRVDRIDVTPVDCMDRPILHPYLISVKLILEEEQENKAIDYPSPVLTSSEQCMLIAKRWLRDCIGGHARCREETPADWLPTRLIDVGLIGDSQRPRLILTSELKSRSDNRYVTLSHRWASTHVVKLQSSNIDSFRQCIPVDSLSSTFQEAIKVTRALNVRYLWVDSLCIIQDSVADWQAESTEMASVYRNCVCNIAATGSSDGGGGLFQERNPHWVTPSKVHIQYRGHDKIYLASLDDLWGKLISRSALNRRGWVCQERLLSPRTLHFASQLMWECRMLQACETYPEGMPSDSNWYPESDGDVLPISSKNWQEECKGTEFWFDVIRSYGRCSITEPNDKLIAIAGIAKSLQPILKDEYLAGLWKKDLPYNLVWSLSDIEGEPKLSERYKCPSWSWAALDYKSATISRLLVPADYRVETLVNIQEVHIEPLGSDTYGLLRGGYLRLKGRVGRIVPLNEENVGWNDRCKSFEIYTDLTFGLVDNESLYCLPLLVRKLFPGPEKSFEFADCLLLKQLRPGAFEYTRVGVIEVSLHSDGVLPQEIKWIAGHANPATRSENLVTVTIY